MTTTKTKGRPRQFNQEQALQQAMLLFWENGYEGTSIANLTRAMNMNAPSIYATFGDKKKLFLQAVAYYLNKGQTSPEPLELPEATSARESVATILKGVAALYTGEKTPPGCLVGSAALSVSEASGEIRQALTQIRTQMEAQLSQRIQQDIDSRKLPAEASAEALAAFTMATIQGMSTLARDGASREKLLTIAQLSLQAWPE